MHILENVLHSLKLTVKECNRKRKIIESWKEEIIPNKMVKMLWEEVFAARNLP